MTKYMSDQNIPVYNIITVNAVSDELLASLYQLSFDSFEEKETSIEAYILATLCDDDFRKDLTDVCNKYNTSWTEQVMPNINWNEEWESKFDPVEIDDFVRVRANFHESKAPDFTFELLIHPKMAFGTGHHQTTTMMVRALKDTPCDNKSVFDYGCGTGILAIVAEKLGATDLDAVDNEYPAYESTIENAEVNDCTHINAIFGTLDDVPQRIYDVVLANINRNILLNTGADLVSRLAPDGTLLLSGLLKQDFETIKSYYLTLGIQIVDRWELGDWICLKCTR